MKFKTLLLLATIVLFKSLQPALSQNIFKTNSNSNLPHYIKELKRGLPPAEMRYTDPRLYEHLLKRRAVLSGILQKQVQDGKLPKEALEVLNTNTSITGDNFSNSNELTNKTTATNFHLTKDINKETSSYPSNERRTYTDSFAVLKKCIYYAADDGIHGTELWRSDGTETGTYMVKDIAAGNISSSPFDITASQYKIYFSAYSPETGYELYESDGTAEGTILLKDITAGLSSSYPNNLTTVKGKLYFVVGNQLWKTNGTPETTELVVDLYASSLASGMNQLTAVNDILFFTAYSSFYGRQLWKSNGSANGTLIVKYINPYYGSDFYGPSNLTSFNNLLYFSAVDNTYYRNLWVSDGTDNGTQKVENNDNVILQDYYYDSYYSHPFSFTQTALFFSGYNYNTGTELYKYEPSKTVGIKLVSDITPGYTGTSISTETLRSMNGNIYFTVSDATALTTLWKSGGVAGNTKALKSFSSYIDPSSLYASDTNLYFTTYSAANGYEPWITNGSTQGTRLLKDINKKGNSYPYYFTACNGNVLFSATSNDVGRELWATKGNTQSTVLVKDINTLSTANSVYPYYYSADSLNSKNLIFRAYTPDLGYELWRSDGTEQGTVLVKDLVTGENSSNPEIYEVKNGKAYFSAYDEITGTEAVFSTDGTSEGTKRIAIINNYYLFDLHVTDNGIVFFSTADSYFTSYKQLWRTDSSGLYYRVVPSFGGEFATAGNYCFFAGGSYYDIELWKSDGTIQGTSVVKDINQGSFSSSFPGNFMPLNNKIIFRAGDNVNGNGIYVSDGTSQGTLRLSNAYIYSFYDYAVFKGKLYFDAELVNDFPNIELWSTDGTVNGTKEAADIYPGSVGSYPANLAAGDNALYFTADDGVHGRELWKLSGKTLQASLVKNIAPGNQSPGLLDLTAVGNKLYFVDTSGAFWQSDGTPGGTQIITDPLFNDVNDIGNLQTVGNKLFFTGDSYNYGYEVYVGEPAANKSLDLNNPLSIIINKTTLSAQLASNPFYSDLKINITSPQKQQLTITVTNSSGQKIIGKVINVNAGVNTVSFNGSQWQSGLYIINISSGTETVSLKAIK